MAMDQPTIVYHKDKSQMKNGGHTKNELDALADRWASNHKSLVGQKVSLSEYFNNNNEIKRKG